MDIEYADYQQLKEKGIAHTIRHDQDVFGNPQRTIICNDGTQWDYMPEDQIYERRTSNLFQLY